jgi:hypothetical protein
LFTKRDREEKWRWEWNLCLKEAWAPPSMEELWRLRHSLFYGDCYFLEEGALVEEGTHLGGIRRPCTRREGCTFLGAFIFELMLQA